MDVVVVGDERSSVLIVEDDDGLRKWSSHRIGQRSYRYPILS